MQNTVPDTMKAFELTSYTADQNSFRIIDKPVPAIKENGVLIKMHAAPINPSDLMFMRGLYGIKKKLPVVPGFEGSGTVIQCGSAVKQIQPGMSVSCTAPIMGDGTYAQYMHTSEENCIPLIKNVSLEQGATFFVNPLTAWAMVGLAEEGNHRAIIQTAAASALGKMIQKLCARKNIEVINIVRRQEQVETLQAMGSQYILNSTDAKFLRDLKRMAKKLQATYFLDAVAGELAFEILTAMPYGSQALVYGALSEQNIPVNAGIMLFQKKTLSGFWLSSWSHEKGNEFVIQTAQQAQTYLDSDLHTEIHKIFPISQAYEAIEYYKTNMSKGKTLITMQPD